MKAVILAGGLGSRLSEETQLKPKPMVEIGGRPILWHIMKIYSAHGIDDFVVCLGYKGYMIKEYFANYFLHRSDVTVDLATGAVQIHQNASEPWRVTLVDTGEATLTGGRLQRVLPYLDDEDFCFTYGDGVSDVDVSAVVRQHQSSDALVTLTAVQPPGRYGSLDLDGSRLLRFTEKPAGDGGWINGGFFVVSPGVSSYLHGDQTSWEREPLEQLAAEGKVGVHRHPGFWQAMDTLRDRALLDDLCASGTPPWLA